MSPEELAKHTQHVPSGALSPKRNLVSDKATARLLCLHHVHTHVFTSDALVKYFLSLDMSMTVNSPCLNPDSPT